MNLRKIKNEVLEGHLKSFFEEKPFILVVKDNAYGFGLERVIPLCQKVGIHDFAVKNIEEAVLVRDIDSQANILLLGKMKIVDLERISTYHILPTINDFEDYLLIKEHQLPCHLAIDMGMNRFGMKNGYLAVINDPLVKAIYTHLYESKELDQKIRFMEQLAKRYQKALHIGGSMAYHHTNATPRIGKMVYQDILYFYGHIVNIKHLKKGETVGYNSHFTASEDTLIGVCDIGYANGLSLFYHGSVWIRDHFYSCVGRCCMDQCFIQIDEHIAIGDEVEFFGNHISEEQFAEANGMSVYEVFLTINQEKEI